MCKAASNAAPILDPGLRRQFVEQVQAMKTGSPFLKTIVLRLASTVHHLLAQQLAGEGTTEMSSGLPCGRSELFESIARELDRAYAKHGADQWGRHEFYAILKEEVDELWDAIKKDAPQCDVIDELTQVAAMCFRYYETGDRYRAPVRRPAPTMRAPNE